MYIVTLNDSAWNKVCLNLLPGTVNLDIEKALADSFTAIKNYDRKHHIIADVYYGHDREVLERRKQIKQKTMLLRRKQKRSFRLAEIEGKVYMNTETISSLFAQFVQNLLTIYREW